MPRHARLMLPGQSFHIVQRGVNKGAIFVDDLDRELFLRLLHKGFARYGVALHAYVLMGNHVHLLATPSTSGALAAAMRWQGTAYVQAFNRRHARSGPLWQGRFHSTMVDCDAYLLSVHRYIELNPVRAGLVDDPRAHAWSSVHGNLARCTDPLLTPHATFLGLGDTSQQRAERYARFLGETCTHADATAIRRHARQQRPWGGERFLQMVQETLGRPVALRPMGRPPKCMGQEGQGDSDI